ncbi:nucleotidyltransferase family protein [Sphingobium sp. CECT 9361]|uniref:nucleotidyltransferase domain-containing protein n=1 Tax=Sphingobium sp. CECT 9361 TaxID=2845384 RepID=UPI001E2D9EFD|nr:nucleotidyltransferase family protein [Sphingobium sp. CECT 9361]CAH0350105.1 hypothetical protein SPH9361_00941 [Sphingobium sp. CECT 9361]
MTATLLVQTLRDPASAARLSAPDWNALIAAARAERLIGTLAYRLEHAEVPAPVRPILADARTEAVREARQALWEADRARAALAPLNIPVVLLKGTAYAAAHLSPAQGRFIGDLDILVPRAALDAVEAALIAAGWEWVKPDPYDDAYYRQWMHELPPLIHRDRDRMIDVHHSILPLTARPKPDAAALLTDSIPISEGSLKGLRILSPTDRICHAAAHMLADGDLSGGLRNLWDIHCLLTDLAPSEDLPTRTAHHGLTAPVAQAQRLARHLYAPHEKPAPLPLQDRLIAKRLLATNAWGQETQKPLRMGYYLRSHALRMPPMMLARHLVTKWRKGHRG